MRSLLAAILDCIPFRQLVRLKLYRVEEFRANRAVVYPGPKAGSFDLRANP